MFSFPRLLGTQSAMISSLPGLAAGRVRVAFLTVVFALVLGAFSAPAAEPPALAKSATAVSDVTLYRHISARLEQGQDYYTAAAQEQRYHGFPLRPAVTVRLPTMAWLNTMVDPQTLLRLLLAVTAFAWATVPGLAPTERPAVALLVVAGSWQVFADYSAWIHEYWAALLIALSAALYGRTHWWLSVVAGTAAVFVRELALPFLLLAGTFAFFDGRRREAAGWAVAVALFVVAMAVHAYFVSRVALPQDNVSAGWLGLRGYSGAIHRVAFQSPLAVLGAPFANIAVALALVGWLGLRNRLGLFVFLYLLGMTAMLAIFPRSDNLFWSITVQPLWLGGLAFLPRIGTWLVRGGPYWRNDREIRCSSAPA